MTAPIKVRSEVSEISVSLERVSRLNFRETFVRAKENRKMNADGCSEGYRTDNFFLFAPIGSCDVPIVAYAVLAALVISGRIVNLVVVSRQWHDMYMKRRVKAVRFPLTPLMQALMLLLQALFLILAGVDVISSRNGTTGVVYVVWAAVYTLFGLMAIKKLVGLGSRLAGISKPLREQSGAESTDEISWREAALRNFDVFHKVVLSLAIGSMLIALVFFIVLGAIVFPGKKWTLQGGFFAIGSFLVFIVLSICWQFERCIQTIQAIAAPTINQESSAPIKFALRKMRIQQLTVTMVALPSGIIYILNGADVIPFTWIWVFVHTSLDVVFALIFAASGQIIRCSRRLAVNSSSKKSSKDASVGPSGLNPKRVTDEAQTVAVATIEISDVPK